MRVTRLAESSLIRMSVVAFALVGSVTHVSRAPAQVRATVDLDRPIRTMGGGIGASWHAIEKPIVDRYDPRFGLALHGGSGWGGNPPVTNAGAWQQIEHHAKWLGLDFIRVEFEQRMYEPKRKQFDFDNPEMQAMYRILDWCEKNHADVFLQQMWSNVAWNTWEPWQDDPRAIVHSGPRSMKDFADGLATCVEHLVKNRGYTCIRWLSITNEPGDFWGWWQRPSNEPMPQGEKVDSRKSVPMDLPTGWKAVRKELDRRGIELPLCGPQRVPPPELDPNQVKYDSLLGAYDLHSYYAQYDWMPKHGYYYPLRQLDKRLGDWTRWAHDHGKPFFLTELGCKVFGETTPKGEDRTTAAMISFPAALHNAEIVVRGLNLGIDGFNRWSLTNRGDLDGQWQMITTFDPKTGKYLDRVEPKPNAYFVYGLLSRFTAKHSTSLGTRVDGGSLGACQRVFAAALRSPRGALTVAVVNDAERAWNLSIDLDNLDQATRLHRYAISNADRDRADLRVEPDRHVELKPGTASFVDRVAPQSLTIFTSYRLDHDDPGIIVEPNNARHASMRDAPLLVVGYPGPPPDHVNLERYREIAEAGIDVIAPALGSWDGPANLKALDLAKKVGLRVIVTDQRVLPWHIEDRKEVPRQKIDAVVADYRDHPALFGYFICDEPHKNYFKALASTSRRLQVADPKHPPLINLFPSYASPTQLGFDDFRTYVHSFVETVKPVLLSYDHYPLRNRAAGPTDWFGDLAVMRTESRAAGIPFWICLQSEGLGEALRIPTRAEILWQASTVLAYGTRGVVWFTYWTPSITQEIPPDSKGRDYLPEQHKGGMLSLDGKRTPRYQYVRTANRFLHSVGNMLTGWDNAHVGHWHNGAIVPNGESPVLELHGLEFNAVVGTFARGGQRRVVIANESHTSAAEFGIRPKSGWRVMRVLAMLEAQETVGGDGQQIWALGPGGCVVVECSRTGEDRGETP